jgi:uncharacterized protein
MDNSCDSQTSCCSKWAKPLVMLAVGFVLAFSFVISGQKIYDGLTHFKSYDRYITVKGLATKDVDADLAVWSLTFNVAGETLAGAQENLAMSDKTVREFLIKNGMKAEQVRLQNMNVVDRKAQIYNSGGDMTLRYVLSQTLVVRTNDISSMVKASQSISDLVKAGVTLGDPNGGGNAAPQYLFTKINDIKPELIAEATKNARNSAEQFAKDSGQEIGSIRTANQGYIQIEARDPGISEAESPQKSVRVVTTIDYLLGK